MGLISCLSAFFAAAIFSIPSPVLPSASGWPAYDYSAYTKCQLQPEDPLYGGGILKGETTSLASIVDKENGTVGLWPAFVLPNLTNSTFYSISSWIKIGGSNSLLIIAKLLTVNSSEQCVGTVVASPGCWSFLKGGFVFNSEPNASIIYFQTSDNKTLNIEITSASLQPFTKQQWAFHQQQKIDTGRKRAVIIHVLNKQGVRIHEATVRVEQISKEFPFGTAISKTIIGNSPYQKWFLERFNAAVLENEVKWDLVEVNRGETDYTLADRLLEFVRANQIIVRGHNVVWENPKYNPAWVRNLTGLDLELAVRSRVHSLMAKYKDEFVHWDISNELLHFDFYEQRLGPNATLEFFKMAHEADPLATLFINDCNVVEYCDDTNSTVDIYISKIKELISYGAPIGGIGLEGHYKIPNIPLLRAILDKLATLGLPVWLTELDITFKNHTKETQANQLEGVLREAFSHHAVNGIMLWSALRPDGTCYQMCLTDANMNNLPAGDVVDKLLKEWQTGVIESQTDERGSFSFYGFFGEYKVTAGFDNKTASSTFYLTRGDDTRHVTVQI